MLQLSKSFLNQPVMSLRNGARIATAIGPIINPNNLRIEGFYCQDRFSKNQLILLEQDIRDVVKQGFIVNDHDVLSEPSELIRLKEVLEINFQLQGKPVYSSTRHKLGKVNDFAADIETMYIQKIYIGQTLVKSIRGGQLSIDRNQIIEVTNRKIVIQEPLQPTKVMAGAPA